MADAFHVTSCCAILCRSQDEIPRVCKRWAQLSESPRLWRNIVISPDALRSAASRQMNVLPWLRRRFGAVQSLMLAKLNVRTLPCKVVCCTYLLQPPLTCCASYGTHDDFLKSNAHCAILRPHTHDSLMPAAARCHQHLAADAGAGARVQGADAGGCVTAGRGTAADNAQNPGLWPGPGCLHPLSGCRADASQGSFPPHISSPNPGMPPCAPRWAHRCTGRWNA